MHDFVARHVTGIIVQANAALTLQHTAPEQAGPLLQNIARSGSETPDSMRRLVRVLREDDHDSVRPGQVRAELARLVSAFSGEEADVQMYAAAAAREERRPRSGNLRAPCRAGGTDQRAPAPAQRRGRRTGRRGRAPAAGRGAQHRADGAPPRRVRDRRRFTRRARAVCSVAGGGPTTDDSLANAIAQPTAAAGG
ncbi:histidine kinase dimerization/phosphoacceptor domain-containing protein [Streptomyces sp. NPDC002845]